MFCGTLAVHGKVEPAERFALELADPVPGRTLGHHYRTVQLPVEG